MTYYIVEDELIVSLSLEITISKDLNRQVLGHASSEEEAFDDIVRLKPDVILCDFRLSPGSGMSLLNRLRKVPEMGDLKVVFMTGYSLNSEEEKSLSSFKFLLAQKPSLPIKSILEKIEQM